MEHDDRPERGMYREGGWLWRWKDAEAVLRQLEKEAAARTDHDDAN